MKQKYPPVHDVLVELLGGPCDGELIRLPEGAREWSFVRPVPRGGAAEFNRFEQPAVRARYTYMKHKNERLVFLCDDVVGL